MKLPKRRFSRLLLRLNRAAKSTISTVTTTSLSRPSTTGARSILWRIYHWKFNQWSL